MDQFASIVFLVKESKQIVLTLTKRGVLSPRSKLFANVPRAILESFNDYMSRVLTFAKFDQENIVSKQLDALKCVRCITLC